MTVKLYRAVCRAEAEQAFSIGRLSIVAVGLEGKWFAESASDARRWGEQLTRLSGVQQDIILEVEFSSEIAEKLFRLALLDGIGPARFATTSDLPHAGRIREVTLS